jgi:hypothetical protein
VGLGVAAVAAEATRIALMTIERWNLFMESAPLMG